MHYHVDAQAKKAASEKQWEKDCWHLFRQDRQVNGKKEIIFILATGNGDTHTSKAVLV